MHVSPAQDLWGAHLARLEASVLTMALLTWPQLLSDYKPLDGQAPAPGLLPGTRWQVPPQGSDVLLPLPGGLSSRSV